MYIVDMPDAAPLVYSLKSVSSFWQALISATAISPKIIFFITVRI